MSLFLSALGTAAKSGSTYFSQLHLQQTRQKNLADARAYASKEKTDDRERQDTLTDEARDYADGNNDKARVYAEKAAQDKYSTSRSDKAADAADADKRNLEQYGKKLEIKGEYEAGDGQGEEDFTKPETVTLASGEVVMAQHGNKGTLQLRPDLSVPAGSKNSVESTAKYRGDLMDKALGDLKGIIGVDRNGNPLKDSEGNPVKGYDPTTFSAWKDSVLNSTDVTNWASSSEGQQFASAQKRVIESLLRSATGAAAPDSEQTAYALMFGIRVGDNADTVKMKLSAMEQGLQSIQSIYMDEGFKSLTDDEQHEALGDNLDKIAQSYGLKESQAKTQRNHPSDIEAILNRSY